ncbi:hypothetical protein IAQ61_006716 [Plenodomus lingam]|uniref:uncharacterized protein n=1 Tax=Leptosphaeria maculans TaxID=5022 RepID=UPI0033264B76|nr:hypothetical protein IAQ61_006716 [Plenodomus lingam]
MQSRNDLIQAQHFISVAVVEGNDWTVAEIAAKVGLSIGHLHRLFKKYSNTTPRDFAAAQLPVHRAQNESQFISSGSLDNLSMGPEPSVVQSISEPLLWLPWDSWTSDLERLSLLRLGHQILLTQPTPGHGYISTLFLLNDLTERTIIQIHNHFSQQPHIIQLISLTWVLRQCDYQLSAQVLQVISLSKDSFCSSNRPSDDRARTTGSTKSCLKQTKPFIASANSELSRLKLR